MGSSLNHVRCFAAVHRLSGCSPWASVVAAQRLLVAVCGFSCSGAYEILGP